MAYYSPEVIKQIKEVDLYTYLKTHDPEELVYESHNSYTTKSHDSLKISNGMWYWFSRGIGGKTALEYLIQVKGYSFLDAVSHLLAKNKIEKRYTGRQKLTEKEKIDRLILPKAATNNDRVTMYLRMRGISKDIIDECINKGYIYQDYPKNNVVFVGFDENNNPRYAGIRGTSANRYMHDASGSDKTYSFKLESVIDNDEVHLFESAIDLLSYATLKELKKERWDEENLLSLAGIYQPAKDIMDSKVPKTLAHFIKNHPNISKIIIHFDNDEAGRLATQALKNALSDHYEIIDEPPKSGKDYNDFLLNFLKMNLKKDSQCYR